MFCSSYWENKLKSLCINLFIDLFWEFFLVPCEKNETQSTPVLFCFLFARIFVDLGSNRLIQYHTIVVCISLFLSVDTTYWECGFIFVDGLKRNWTAMENVIPFPWDQPQIHLFSEHFICEFVKRPQILFNWFKFHIEIGQSKIYVQYSISYWFCVHAITSDQFNQSQ